MAHTAKFSTIFGYSKDQHQEKATNHKYLKKSKVVNTSETDYCMKLDIVKN